MRILLATLNAKYIHTNLAIRLLFELNKDRADLSYKEFTIKEDKGDIARFCADFEVVAFSCYIWNITQTLAASRAIKSENPNIKILLGGPEVSYDWQDIIALEEVDFIITGEGETPFQEFIENYPHVENVGNLVHKQAGQVQYFQKNDTFDLSRYQDIMPYVNDNPEELRNKVLYIETSRGCPYKCEFCLASLDNKVRYLPDTHIKSTLLHLMKHGRVIKFLDRTFNIKRDFTIDMFKFILEHRRPENIFQFEITADILHPDIVQFIHDHVPPGLFRFEIGIQTVNQKANLEVSRKQNFEKTKKIIQSLEHKIEMHLDLIVGLALDEWEDIKYSFEEVFRLFPPELQLGFLKFLKGTPVRDKHEQHGFVFDANPPYQIIESNYLSREQLFQIELVEHVLEIYWNKRRAGRTLQYVTQFYSVFDFMLGLGTRFSQIREFHGFDLFDVYEIIDGFIADQYADDPILRQLLALDYYEQHKVKPREMILPDLDAEAREQLISDLGADTRLRHVVLALSFDLALFEQMQQIEKKEMYVVFQYDGRSKPERISGSLKPALEILA